MSEIRRKKRRSLLPYVAGGVGLAGLGTAYLGHKVLSPEDRQLADEYLQRSAAWKAEDPRTVLNDYAVQGARAANLEPFGMPLPQFMRETRGRLSNFFDAASKIAPEGLSKTLKTQANVVRPNEGSTHHYNQFVTGPFNGYSTRLLEFFGKTPEDDARHYPTGYSMTRGIETLKSNGQFSAESLGLDPKNPETSRMVADVNAAAARLQKDVGPVTASTSDFFGKHNKMIEAIKSKHNEYLASKGAPSHEALPLQHQLKNFPGFDSWLAKHDPQLWKNKQVLDFTAGVGAKINNPYAGYIGAGTALQDKLKTVGYATAGVGAAGLLAYFLYKKLGKKRKPADNVVQFPGQRKAASEHLYLPRYW